VADLARRLLILNGHDLNGLPDIAELKRKGVDRVQAFFDRGYDPLVYRFLYLSAHYRSQMNFTYDAMDAAKTGFELLRERVRRLGEPAGEPDTIFVSRLMGALNKNIYSHALGLLFELLKSDLPAAQKKATALKIDEALGLDLT
jgi:cysteinyl-tRNA synthetase